VTASVGAPPAALSEQAAEPERRFRVEPAFVGVMLGTAVLIAIHLLSWWTERRGFPLFVDESGYIGFAFDHKHAFDQDGLRGLFDSFRDHPVYAQLVPLLTVPLLVVFGDSITAAYLAILAFYGVMVVATYGVARRVVSPWWAALAALVVALVPQVITFARMYYFAIPVAAWLAVAVWCYLRSDACNRPVWAVAGGAALGLAALSRTMAVAFVAGPLIAAAIQVLYAPTRRVRRFLALGAGAVLGFALGLTWYSDNLGGARKQLEGRFQGIHGTGNPSLTRGAREIHQVIEVFQVPLAVLLAAIVILALVFVGQRHWEATPGEGDALAAKVAEDAESTGYRLLRFMAGGLGFVLIVVIVGALALLVAREALAQWIPLVPFIGVLVVAGLASLPAGALRTGLVVALVAVSVFNLAMLSDVWSFLGKQRTVDAGPVGNVTITDGRSWMDTALARNGYPTGRPGHTLEVYAEWPPLYSDLTSYMVDFASERGEAPVVLSQADALMTPNALILADRLLYDSPRLGVGPLRTGTDYREQLNSPDFGLPNFVLTFEPHSDAPNRAEREREAPKVEAALNDEGFGVVRTFELPDGREAQLWWRPRGS
jgi:hypothetical protein